ncbi:MAG: AlpA family phage regulatory protein [Rhodanobacter sp.]
MTQSVHPVPPRLSILRRREVEARVKLSRSTIYLRIAEHSFPTPIRLGTGRAVGWIEQEIEAWLQEQVAASRKAAE